MHRQKAIYTIAPGQYDILKQQMLNWANQFSIFLFLDSNHYTDTYSRYACLLACGVNGGVNELAVLQKQHDENPDWWFGHVCYDYKNKLEPKLSSAKKYSTGWGETELSFFNPEYVLHVNPECTELTIESLEVSPDEVYKQIQAVTSSLQEQLPKLSFQKRIDEQSYLSTIRRLRQHIADGDCYEINFCVEGYTDVTNLNTLNVFNKLNELSPAPFAAYYKSGHHSMMCSSPERYLRKEGDVVMSQPIKGTAKRDADKIKDEQHKVELAASIKERAENVMIVDLVRNDLARSCEVGSIKVDELFGIYSFPQVHQMISTVSGTIKKDTSFIEAIRHSFPMGSMTGAPKIKVMQLIEHYEQSRRELFSGTVGYITPVGDFDFNVIIRSLFYNDGGYLSYQTGGAITYDSVPEHEWDEMRLKAWALERIFS